MPKFYITLEDCTTYAKTVEAESEQDAIEEAQRIWEDVGPEEFEIVGSNTDGWDCQKSE